MSGQDAPAGAPGARQLLEQEQRLAILESGGDLWLRDGSAASQRACIEDPLRRDTTRFALVIVPDLDHPICGPHPPQGDGIRAVLVRPDMPESGRRDLGIALRDRTVQLVFVTPERLSQPKFIQFVRSQAPFLTAVASCQRLCDEAADYFPPYESLRALRGLFPGVPVLALEDGAEPDSVRRVAAAALGFRVEPMIPGTPGTPATPETPETPETPTTPDSLESLKSLESPESLEAPVVHDALRSAFPLFDQGTSVADTAQQLGRDTRWVGAALAAYIRHTGRTHPFPWVDKPTYLAVSMMAGQAETTAPKLILSLLKGAVDESSVLPVLAALENRRPKG